jgi:hypothetical protein
VGAIRRCPGGRADPRSQPARECGGRPRHPPGNTSSIPACSPCSPSTKSTACAPTSQQGLTLYRLRVRSRSRPSITLLEDLKRTRQAGGRDHHLPADGRRAATPTHRARHPDGVGVSSAQLSEVLARATTLSASSSAPAWQGGHRHAHPAWVAAHAHPDGRIPNAPVPRELEGLALGETHADRASRRTSCRCARWPTRCAWTSASWTTS